MWAELSEIFLGVCFPIVAVSAVGWAYDKKFGLDLRTLVRLNLYLFVPCLIFVRLSTVNLPGNTPFVIPFFTLCVVTIMAVISTFVGRLAKVSKARQRALRLSTMMYNSGNYGLPLVILAFGEAAQDIQVFVLATQNIVGNTLGVFFASAGTEANSRGFHWRQFLPVFRMPALYMIALALMVRAFEIPVQEASVIWFPMSVIAEALVPVALITLGVQLSKTKWKPSLFRDSLLSSGIRLIGGPLVGFVLIQLFGFEGMTAAIVLVGTAVPTAVNSALLAAEFGADDEFAASTVMFSTLLSMITVTGTILCAKLLYLP